MPDLIPKTAQIISHCSQNQFLLHKLVPLIVVRSTAIGKFQELAVDFGDLKKLSIIIFIGYKYQPSGEGGAR